MLLSLLQFILIPFYVLLSGATALPTLVAPFLPPVPDTTLLLNAHNNIRAAHGANPLTWSSSLEEKAQVWANLCVWQNTGGVLSTQPYGENLAAGTGNFTQDVAVALFVQDESAYDPLNPTYNHFTQVVWKGTTSLGCAVATCSNIFPSQTSWATYYVCLYDPPGNVVGLASQNVQP